MRTTFILDRCELPLTKLALRLQIYSWGKGWVGLKHKISLDYCLFLSRFYSDFYVFFMLWPGVFIWG
jgi:hypothetical protein